MPGLKKSKDNAVNTIANSIIGAISIDEAEGCREPLYAALLTLDDAIKAALAMPRRVHYLKHLGTVFDEDRLAYYTLFASRLDAVVGKAALRGLFTGLFALPI